MFWQLLEKSEDLNDELPGLAEYLNKNLGATGVYIGKLEPKMKPINEDDDDAAHIDTEGPLVLNFKYANEDHKDLMIGKVLEPSMGISHSLFGASQQNDEDEGDEE